MSISNNSKLVFCGNSSFDHITTFCGVKTVIGGSAINSAISALLSSKKDISIISSIGNDFPQEFFEKLNINTQYIYKHDSETNIFEIDEIKNSVILKNRNYLQIIIPENMQTDCLHISCRRGVPFVDAIKKIKAEYYSLDVMYSSIEVLISELKDCLKKINFLFCNNDEFIIMGKRGLLNMFPKNLIIFVTDKMGVCCRRGVEKKFYSTISEKDPVSTVGAGDTFLGGFLASFNGDNFDEAIYQALAIASISIKDFGVVHLLDRNNEINRARNKIRDMDKCNETKFNIYNWPIM